MLIGGKPDRASKSRVQKELLPKILAKMEAEEKDLYADFNFQELRDLLIYLSSKNKIGFADTRLIIAYNNFLIKEGKTDLLLKPNEYHKTINLQGIYFLCDPTAQIGRKLLSETKSEKEKINLIMAVFRKDFGDIRADENGGTKSYVVIFKRQYSQATISGRLGKIQIAIAEYLNMESAIEYANTLNKINYVNFNVEHFSVHEVGKDEKGKEFDRIIYPSNKNPINLA